MGKEFKNCQSKRYGRWLREVSPKAFDRWYKDEFLIQKFEEEMGLI